MTPFKIENLTDDRKLDVRINTSLTSGKWALGEELFLITPPPDNYTATNPSVKNAIMMGVFFLSSDTTLPVVPAGTAFIVRTTKPFSTKDEYTFTTSPINYDAQKAASQLDKVYVVPNPYVISSQFEQPGNLPNLRGDKVLQFRNLPAQCTIRIYTITGELVQTLRKDDLNDYLSWDILTSESARVGYGVYIYHVETPVGGSKIGRFALIK
jgi:hypothetical protein